MTRPIKAKEPKSVRVGKASACMKGRRVYLPKEATWLQQCFTELLGFPAAKHDDITYSVVQYLN